MLELRINLLITACHPCLPSPVFGETLFERQTQGRSAMHRGYPASLGDRDYHIHLSTGQHRTGQDSTGQEKNKKKDTRVWPKQPGLVPGYILECIPIYVSVYPAGTQQTLHVLSIYSAGHPGTYPSMTRATRLGLVQREGTIFALHHSCRV